MDNDVFRINRSSRRGPGLVELHSHLMTGVRKSDVSRPLFAGLRGCKHRAERIGIDRVKERR